MNDASMRLDRFLWFVRLVKTRGAAQELAEAGMLRLDGRRIEKSSVQVRVGSVIAFPLRGQVRILRVEGLPLRRGPAPEAQGMYQELTPGMAESRD
ncbi:RNA-binding S4 domain-containing protein [Sphingomonas turrisvirgatae]|uniref:RNA-binding protein n=1 Tax=Sphingomonas turrisvirgatae TaxID=1888892 RepID=A0A1E3LV35_9SPHN|nr:RNA-binding S4 domain-containing protein [Sphingomonas turrisvirgatae]ODP37593.1 RNA-binding protein [Sphingomonas turrisvirgatae]